MKRTFVTALGYVLALIMFVFGYLQKLEADQQRSLAVAAQLQAEEAMKVAEMERARAEQERAFAEEQRKIAEQNAMLAAQNAMEARRQQALSQSKK